MLRYPLAKQTFNILAVCCLLITNYAFAQSNQISKPQIWGEPDGLSGADCETTKAVLDDVAITDRETGKDQLIIIIARLGNGENSRTLIRQRLRQAADYLNLRVSKDKIVTAEGERVSGLGQIEFYVGGKLHSVFKMKRNRDLAKGCGD